MPLEWIRNTFLVSVRMVPYKVTTTTPKYYTNYAFQKTAVNMDLESGNVSQRAYIIKKLPGGWREYCMTSTYNESQHLFSSYCFASTVPTALYRLYSWILTASLWGRYSVCSILHARYWGSEKLSHLSQNYWLIETGLNQSMTLLLTIEIYCLIRMNMEI